MNTTTSVAASATSNDTPVFTIVDGNHRVKALLSSGQVITARDQHNRYYSLSKDPQGAIQLKPLPKGYMPGNNITIQVNVNDNASNDNASAASKQENTSMNSSQLITKKLFGDNFDQILNSEHTNVLRNALATAFEMMAFAEKKALVNKLVGVDEESLKANIADLENELEGSIFSLRESNGWHRWETDELASIDFNSYEDALIDAVITKEACLRGIDQ